MKSRRIRLWVIIPIVAVALIVTVTYRVLAPLPAPIPPSGQILDAATGQGIPGAELETRWRLYDYPMIDGAGSYEVSTVTVADGKGRFSLVIPNRRRGFWKTDTFPPIITAVGYRPFTFDDISAVKYVDGESTIIELTPE